jgi:predicted sulfurtransferase
MKVVTIAMYQFVRLSGLPELREKLKQKCLECGFKGTILIAPEGINCFLFGTVESIAEFKEYIKTELGLAKHPEYKENACSYSPFNRMLVKIKKEIIPMGNPEIRPDEWTAPYLSALELKTWLDENRDFVLLDTRNDYEIAVGTFEKATPLGISHFRDFSRAVAQLPEETKKRPVVTFCTGGIRCEKAAALMKSQGFEEVYQLEGGILKYFEEHQDAHYQGQCFVFDWRLAVDGQLQPQSDQPRERPAGTTGRHIGL